MTKDSDVLSNLGTVVNMLGVKVDETVILWARVKRILDRAIANSLKEVSRNDWS